jgi:N utilization substance protein B
MTPRRAARAYALQGLYAWQLTGAEVIDIATSLREDAGFKRVDEDLFRTLLHGVLADTAALDALLAPLLDRPAGELSPIEHGILWLAAYELSQCIATPYRVIINEAIELAKSYGGTDGHKYVNGVVDKLARTLRALEFSKDFPGKP